MEVRKVTTVSRRYDKVMTGKQVVAFLLEHNQDPIYAGVDGFVPRRVEDFSVAIVDGSVQAHNVGDFIMLENPGLHAIGSISFVGEGKSGFSVESVKPFTKIYLTKDVVSNVPCFYHTGISDSLANMPIYRYMPLEYLLGMIRSGENVLVSPLKWEDPFEAAVVKVSSKWHDGSPVDVSVLGTDLFAQCWCADKKESNLRWKAYGGGEVVRIGTTVGKLLESVNAAFLDKTAMSLAAMFGEVIYVPQCDLEKAYSEMPLMRYPELVSSCMLLKRDAYR